MPLRITKADGAFIADWHIRAEVAQEQGFVCQRVEGRNTAVGVGLEKCVVDSRVFVVINGKGVHKLLPVIPLPAWKISDHLPAGPGESIEAAENSDKNE